MINCLTHGEKKKELFLYSSRVQLKHNFKFWTSAVNIDSLT